MLPTNLAPVPSSVTGICEIPYSCSRSIARPTFSREETVMSSGISRSRDEVFTDALDLVWLRGIARVQRPLRVGPHGHHRRLLLLEEAGDASHGATGAETGNDHVDLAAGLRPDFGAGRFIVGLRVGLVEVLIRLKGARDLVTEPLGDRVVALRRIAWNRRRANHDFGPVGTQQRDLLR